MPKLIKGMWGVRYDYGPITKPNIFELTNEFIKTITKVEALKDGTIVATIDVRWTYEQFFIFETKDELKTYLIGCLFSHIEEYDKDIQDIKEKINKIKANIDYLAGA